MIFFWAKLRQGKNADLFGQFVLALNGFEVGDVTRGVNTVQGAIPQAAEMLKGER